MCASQGGNDYEIFVDPRVIGHSVTGPDDTMHQLATMLDISTEGLPTE